MSKNIIIIGGGIIGLSTAYYLLEEGHEVTILDKSNFSSGASYVNAGYITPSHIISLAAPGMITKGIKWMFDSASPFYVKPRLDLELFKWAWAFKKSATAQKVEQSIPIIKDANILSRDLFEEIKATGNFDFHYKRNGLLMCYKTDKIGEEEWQIGKRAMQEGLKVEHLTTKKEIQEIEPNVDLNIKGAVYFDSDAHMTPSDYMQELLAFLKLKGVKVHANEEVLDIQFSNNKITSISTSKTQYSADEYVLAAGSWSPSVTKKTGIKIPIQAGKGYRINVDRPTQITVPAILCEAKVAVTPMTGYTRFAGTMEIGGINHTINPTRVNSIANAAEAYYNDLSITPIEKKAAQCGLRPCSPDGLPYIGKSAKCQNLTIATGHAMMGWSLGPATGKLVSEIISDKKPSLNLHPFHPDRKF